MLPLRGSDRRRWERSPFSAMAVAFWNKLRISVDTPSSEKATFNSECDLV